MTQQKIIWGFMLENAYFVEFDGPNHQIIETAYQQKKSKQASHYIIIHDSHLPCPARIYFGVIQIHLRMPGTRYYVKRKIISIQSSNHHHQNNNNNNININNNIHWLFPSTSSSMSTLSNNHDSIYTAMPLFTNVQALLIPWSTSPPPSSYSN
ncbi:unnamed protein product [Cunninghamella blakesleeana]